MTLIYITALMASLAVMILVYDTLPIAESVRVKHFEVVSGSTDAERMTLGEAVLFPFVRAAAYAPRSLLRWAATNLYWAQRLGAWKGWTAEMFLGLCMAAGVGGAVFSLFIFGTDAFMLVVLAGLGAWFPTLFLGGKARKARKEFKQSFPHMVLLLIMLMKAGKSVTESLRLLAEGKGVSSAWLRDVLAKAGGRDVLAVLQQEAERTNVPELIRFATRLQQISVHGVGIEELFETMAKDVMGAYQVEMKAKAKALNSQLVLPMLLFDLAPYILVIAYPLAMQLLSLFLSG